MPSTRRRTRRGGVYAKPTRTHPRSIRSTRKYLPRGHLSARNQYAVHASLPPSMRGLELWRHPSKKEKEYDQMQERSKREREEKKAREQAMERAMKVYEREQAMRRKEQERIAEEAEKQLKSIQQKMNRESRAAKRDVARHAMMERIQQEFKRKRGSLAMAGLANALNEAVEARQYDQVLAMLSGMTMNAHASHPNAHAANASQPHAAQWAPIRFSNSNNE